jgi:ATP-dependent Clp protease ATP-binding subunit ClpA
MVMMAVRSHFRPEFINRIDEFIMFDPLEQEQIKSIVRLQVGAAGRPWCPQSCFLVVILAVKGCCNL